MAKLEEMKIEPAITHLRNHFHTIGKEELDRLKPKLKSLDNNDWDQVVYTMERTINKLLHHPAKVAKQEAKKWRWVSLCGNNKNYLAYSITPTITSIKRKTNNNPRPIYKKARIFL